MSSQKRNKLNLLLLNWPPHTVATYHWLEKQGISRQLAQNYVASHWLERIGRGAFARADSAVDWKGGLYPLQQEPKGLIYIAGKTALELQGFGHFLPLGHQRPIWLFGPLGQKLPQWFKKRWGQEIKYVMTDFLGEEGITAQDQGGYSLRISSPERAILEVLYFVPNSQSFEEAKLLMEGLATLQPQAMQHLLQGCTSIKVKRLALVLAEYFRHGWLQELDLSKITLGKGKRSLEKSGFLHSKYQITLPERLGGVVTRLECKSMPVIPAKAGIQESDVGKTLASRLRGNDKGGASVIS